MLDEQQFEEWCRRLGLNDRTVNLIRGIRSSEPARRVRSWRGNVSGRYPSRKMGVTIQFESHRNELAAIYEMEHSSAILEYWDQPTPIKLKYRTSSGRAIGVLHTPDFFVLRTDSVGWEEWKLEEDLRRLSETQPNRYCHSDDGAWHCPPGEKHAQEFGLYYRLRSSAEINWVFQRNLIFLEDYLRVEPIIISLAIEQAVGHMVAAQPGLTLQKLLCQEGATVDAVYLLIATERLYVDLDAVPLADPARVQVFADRETALAYAHLNQTVSYSAPRFIDLACGATVLWDGRVWTIANVGERNIGFLGEDSAFTELPVDVFEMLVKQGKMTCHESERSQSLASQAKLKELLDRAGPEELKEANRRYGIIRPFLKSEPGNGRGLPSRTVYRWLESYRLAESLYGNGYAGLLPRVSERGNRRSTRRSSRASNSLSLNSANVWRQASASVTPRSSNSA